MCGAYSELGDVLGVSPARLLAVGKDRLHPPGCPVIHWIVAKFKVQMTPVILLRFCGT